MNHSTLPKLFLWGARVALAAQTKLTIKVAPQCAHMRTATIYGAGEVANNKKKIKNNTHYYYQYHHHTTLNFYFIYIYNKFYFDPQIFLFHFSLILISSN